MITAIGVAGVFLGHFEVEALNNASSDQEFASLERDSSYRLKQGMGYTGIGVGLGLLTYGLFRLEF